jgi:molybdopterin synthase sulfur carrier subunit
VAAWIPDFEYRTMTIKVKFFAGLRETLNLSTLELEPIGSLDARDVWAQATNNQAMPENTLCAINLEHLELDHAVLDGDEVAFFPPVTGG